jgi:acyl-CoA synthetase (AMP-forming)/AMP-acid ligase II
LSADFGPADLVGVLATRWTDPGRSCLTFEGRTWSWAEVRDTAATMAAALRAAGVQPGDIVATASQNRAELVPLMLAVWSAEAAVAPLDGLLTAGEVAQILEHLRPRVTVQFGAGGLDILPSPPTMPPRRAALTTALVLHTSGTTARPKAVELSAGNLIGAIESVLRTVREGRPAGERTGRGAPNLVAFPLSHLGGMFSTLLALYNDREILLMRRFEVEPFVDLVERHRIPSVILNPTMVYMLCDAPPAADERLRSLRFVRSGSARLSPILGSRFAARFGAPVLNCYGQTETAGEVIGWTVPDLPWAADKPGSVGRPHRGVSIRFVGEDLRDVPDGEVGELCVKAPFIMDGYLDADGAAADFLDDGFLRTGDLGRIDGDGFVWLVGRRKEIVNCGGFKVLPEEVEEALRSHTAVGDVMVAGIPDDRLGEVPWAFVVPREADGTNGEAALADALVEHARARLAPYKAPRGVCFVAELPRTASGKVMRSRAPELLGGVEAAPVS